MTPTDPPEAGDPMPEPEETPGQPIADCFRGLEVDLEIEADDPPN
jgi:hypothetical protein